MRKTGARLRAVCVLMVLFILLSGLLGCASPERESRLEILCTTFPLYDWTRTVVGEAEGVTVSLLVENGTDAHSYQPTPADMAALKRCDVAVLIGGESDGWVREALSQNEGADQSVIELMALDGMILRPISDESGHGHEHDHDHGHDHGDHEHGSAYDEHIWLSLRNAATSVMGIADALSERDPACASHYQGRAEAYAEKLLALDGRYRETVQASRGAPLLFADRYPFVYLMEDYGLHAHAAFAGCSADVGASFASVVELAELVSDLNVTKIMITESSDGALARTVIGASGREDCSVLVLDSLQSVTKADALGKKTYLSVMESNLSVLEEALS